MLLIICVLMGASAWGQGEKQALQVPDMWYNSNAGQYQISFNQSQYVNDEEVYVTIYYSVNGGDYQIYNGYDNVQVPFGSIFSFYASHEDYANSPVTTLTATVPLWNTMEWTDGWYEYFSRGEDEALVLSDNGPIKGFYWIKSGTTGDLISQRLSTPNENINKNFKLSSYGLASAEERTYGFTGLAAGQVLVLYVNTGAQEIIKDPEVPIKSRMKKAARRRIITGNATPLVTAVEGLELDTWNSDDNGTGSWKCYYLRVTADGTVKFKLAAGACLDYLDVMSERAPDIPTYNGPTVSGANRTYKIIKPTGATTLYYTTALASEAPAIGSNAYSSTTENSVEVTVTGEGYLYAYGMNNAGTSEIAEQYVNGVMLTLNAPTISDKYLDGDQWVVTLSSEQYSLEGSPESTIYYRIDEGAETLYQEEAFAVPDGSTLSFWAVADGYTTSPVASAKAVAEPTLTPVWYESYTYWYSSGTLTLGDEVDTGLYQLKFSGSVIRGGHLLTPQENINNSFMMTYYSGISSNEERTYAISGLTAGQYLYVYSYKKVTPLQGLETDLWNSVYSCAHLKVTADGTVKFKVAADHTLRSIYLYEEPLYGDVTVADANGNRLTYHYENPTSAATFTGISSYAADEDKAAHIIIANEVTDSKGNTHEVKYIGSGAFSNGTKLREITFGTGLATNAFANDSYLFYNCSNVQKMTIPGVNFPFQCSFYSLPNTMALFVHPDMVETYKASDYTKKYHILAIGSTTDFDVETTAGGQLATKVPAEVAGNALSLTITGPINGTDINQIHELMPFLEVLDLKNAQIVAGGEEYYRFSFNTSTNKASKDTYYHYATENDVIGQYMFYNMPNLKELSLPNTATTMGNNAVAYNSKLTQVNMPAALTSIGESAFYYDTKLEKADIPAGVTTIGQGAFSNNTVLKTVTIPDGMTRIEASTFYNCDALTTVTLPDNITFIGSYAFYDCEKLQTINIPAQVETIGEYAFYNDYKLSSPITIPSTCKTIGSYAFYSNSQMPSITFNEGLETIGYNAFYNCIKLSEVTLPQSLTSLGSSAFSYCKALKQFVFPANIKQVPYRVLYNCSSLERVALAEGTTQIGNEAFYNCQKLSTVENLNQTTLTSLGSSAFYYTALTTVTLPNSITSMGSNVFKNCTKLESANIPTGINSVPSYTFQNCEKLTSVTMHDDITTVGEYAFDGCKLLPAIALSDQITTISNYAFYNCQSLVLTALPAALKSIGYRAFYNTKALTASLTLPETLTTLREEAFSGSGITGVTIQKNISTFDTEVFYNCAGLATVSLPQDMTKIPDYTFYGTAALQTITLPSALQEIGQYAFYGSGLTEISLPNTLQTIGQYAFYNTQLSEIRVPKNVTSVGTYFAAGCTKLKSAYLGRKQDYTNNSNFDYFAGCNNLELLRVYAGTPPAISSSSSYTGYRTNCVLEVPEGQVDVYKATSIWKQFKEIRAFESDDRLNDADFAMMEQLYERLNGAAWTKPWDLSNQRHSIGKWQGVTTEVDAEDDELFYITDIDLTNQGLVGQLPKSVFGLSKLKTLNLSHNTIEAKVDTLLDSENTVIESINLEGNHLKGDLYPFASKLPNLTKLNVRYNWLTKISQAFSHDKLSRDALQRGYQFIDYQTKQVYVPEELMDDVVINLTLGEPVSLGNDVSFQTYRHSYGDFKYSFSNMYRLYKSGSSLYTSDYELYKNSNSLCDISSSNVFNASKNVLTAYTYGYQNSYYYDYSYDYITFIFRLDWKDGDVNADQTVDVADLQNVVYYALNESKPSNQAFNFTTADANGDSQINVSDIVGCVNRILNYEEQESEPSPARIYNKVEADSRNLIMQNGGTVMLANADEVAALQLTIKGAQQGQLQIAGDLRSRFTVSMRNVDGGVRLVIYSPMGNTLAPGESLLLSGLPADAVITDARLVDSHAAHLSVSFGSTTSIEELPSDDLDLQQAPVYDLSGRRVGKWDTLPAGIYIVRLNGKQFKVRK